MTDNDKPNYYIDRQRFLVPPQPPAAIEPPNAIDPRLNTREETEEEKFYRRMGANQGPNLNQQIQDELNRQQPLGGFIPNPFARLPPAYDRDMTARDRRIETLESDMRRIAEHMVDVATQVKKLATQHTTAPEWALQPQRVKELGERIKAVEASNVDRKQVKEAIAAVIPQFSVEFGKVVEHQFSAFNTHFEALESRVGKLEAVEPKAGANVIIEITKRITALENWLNDQRSYYDKMKDQDMNLAGRVKALEEFRKGFEEGEDPYIEAREPEDGFVTVNRACLRDLVQVAIDARICLKQSGGYLKMQDELSSAVELLRSVVGL